MAWNPRLYNFIKLNFLFNFSLKKNKDVQFKIWTILITVPQLAKITEPK